MIEIHVTLIDVGTLEPLPEILAKIKHAMRNAPQGYEVDKIYVPPLLMQILRKEIASRLGDFKKNFTTSEKPFVPPSHGWTPHLYGAEVWEYDTVAGAWGEVDALLKCAEATSVLIVEVCV